MVPDFIVQALADTTRPAADRSRDAVRRPAELLAFAGVQPGMAVAELCPNGGYFTRLLSNIVGPEGRVYGFDVAEWDGGEDAAMAAEPGHENVSISLGKLGDFAPGEPLDLVWTAQNYHDLHIAEYGADPATFNDRVYAALKPQGIYIVGDHQAPDGVDDAGIAELHRIEKARVLAEVLAAGFVLLEESTLLHDASDDHRLNSSDAAVRGRTDQFLLRFQKI